MRIGFETINRNYHGTTLVRRLVRWSWTKQEQAIRTQFIPHDDTLHMASFDEAAHHVSSAFS
jgi:predicted molibdopterin-dependent oxidoreductase YjgC